MIFLSLVREAILEASHVLLGDTRRINSIHVAQSVKPTGRLEQNDCDDLVASHKLFTGTESHCLPAIIPI